MTLEQSVLSEKPIEDIKPNRWITMSEQRDFCEFLSNVGIEVKNLDWCASTWEKYQCSHDNSHAKKVRYLSCSKRGICPRCSMAYASQRANLQYQWIKQNLADRLDFDLKMNQIVLTLPESLHDIDKKLFSKMIKKFMDKFGIEAYSYCIQTRHSENPLDKEYKHCHILSLNIKRGKNKLVQNEYYFDVEKMRNVWKDIIEKYTDTKIEGSVNLHTEYASILNNKKRVLHLLAYLYRYPIQDLFNVQVRTGSLNYVQCPQIEKNSSLDGLNAKSPHLENIKEKIRDLIEEDKPRIVWCGLLTSSKRKELIEMILSIDAYESLDPIPKYIVQLDEYGKPSFKWKNLVQLEREMRQRAKECRDCGSPYEDQPFETGNYAMDNEPEIFHS